MERYREVFFPSPKQLLYCLRNKVVGRNDGYVIPMIEDFYAHEPWELPGLYDALSDVQSDGWNWYFICRSTYVAQNSERSKRQTTIGQWEVNSKWRDIKYGPTQLSIGSKRDFVFYVKCPGSLLSSSNRSTGTHIKTGWLMYEYLLNPEHLRGYSSKFKVPYVLCHLKRKPSQSLKISPTIPRDSRVTYEDDDLWGALER